MAVVSRQYGCRVQGLEHACVIAALLTAADQRGASPALRRKVLDHSRSRSGSSCGRDFARVEDANHLPSGTFVDDQQPGDVGEPAVPILRVACDPLQGRYVQVLDVHRHGVNERVISRMHARLGRKFDSSRSQEGVSLLCKANLPLMGWKKCLDVVPADIADRPP
jgi:hypothetical protein